MSFFSKLKENQFLKDTVIRSVLLLVFGVVLTINPRLSTQVILGIVAAGLAIYGLFMVIRYFKEKSDAAQGMLTRGLIAIAAAVVLWAMPTLLIGLLPVLIGFLLIVSGVSELETAVRLKRLSAPRWYVALVFGVVIVALGVIIVFNPIGTSMSLIRFIGISMVVTGILELIDTLAFNKD